MKGKKIVIASCVFMPEPVVSATISFDLANYLANTNEVTVISPKPTRPFGYNFEDVSVEKNTKFSHVVVNSYTSPKSKIIPRFFESYSLGKHIVKYIEKHKFNIDVVYINSWPLTSQHLIVKCCKKFNIETVIHIQDIYPETLVNKLPILKSLFYKILLPIDKYSLKNASRIVTISSGMKTHLLRTRKLEENKIKVVYNWQNINKLELNRKESELFTFVFLGSLSPSAQIESIIEAFGELKSLNSRLIIAGSGSDEKKLKDISRKYSESKIDFIAAPSNKVSKIQSKADVLVLSLRDGVGKIALPSKLVSYMFSKKPVLAIVEEDCDIEKIINDADCGWVVRQNDKEAIKNKMVELITIDKKILIEKGKRSKTYAAQNLSREVNLEKLAKVITNTHGD